MDITLRSFDVVGFPEMARAGEMSLIYGLLTVFSVQVINGEGVHQLFYSKIGEKRVNEKG